MTGSTEPSAVGRTAVAGTLREVVLVEPRLVDELGHYATHAVTLAEALTALGVDVTLACDEGVIPAVRARLETAGARVWPVLGCVARTRLRARILVWPALMQALGVGLRRLDAQVDPGVPFIFPSAELDELHQVARMANGGQWTRRTVMQLFYWDRRGADPRFARLEAALVRRAQHQVARAMRSGLRVVGHSMPIARSLTRRLGSEVPDVPLAVDWPDAALGPRAADRPTAVYLGALRDEKGFAVLGRAVDRVTAPVRWEVQAVANGLADDADRTLLVEAVRARGGAVHDAPLAGADWSGLLRRADICVCPYEPARYRERTSAVVIEALGLGAVPVVSDGTWLADFVREVGVGEVFAPWDAHALAAAIDRVANDWPARRAAAEAIAGVVRADHAPTAVAQRLLDVASR